MAGSVAHDLNNLLTSIAGNIDLLVEDLPLSDPRQELARDLRRAVSRASDLTAQLVAFERRPEDSSVRVVDLNAILADAHLMVDRVLGEAIKLDLILADEPMAVRIDPGALEQALMNAVLNAREAMPKGGMLTLVTERIDVPPTPDSDPPVAPTPHVRLRIRDSGPGVDSVLVPQIFDPFFTTQPGDHHSGLGLYAVERIVQQADGFAAVHSEPGWGVTLDLYFPEATTAPETRIAWLDPALRGKGQTVLVVEDENVVQQVTRRVLERIGYKVLLASQGAEALRIASTPDTPIHLLLADVVLPLMNGVEVARRLRRTRPSLRVLFMSGHSENEVAEDGVPPGAPFLPKPFAPETLSLRVHQALKAPPSDLTSPSR